MPYFKYNKEGQDKNTQGNFEPFLNIDKKKTFRLDYKKDGDYKLRLLPPWSNEGAFAKGVLVHFGVGLQKKTVICPNMIGDDLCPYCHIHAIIKSEEIYQADSDAIRATAQYYSNIVNMKDTASGVLVWGYGAQLFFPIKKIQDSGEFGDITDPEEGREILINRQVRGKVSDSVYPAGKISMIQNPDWLDDIVDLDTILPEVDKALVEKLFKSQPWKVYEPKTRVQGADLKTSETKPDVVEREEVGQVKQNAEVVEEKPIVHTSPAENEAKIKALRASLRAKMQSGVSE